MILNRLLMYGGGAVVLALVLLLGLAKMDARHFHKLADQNAALAANYKAQLDAISSEKQAQRIVTKTRIETVTKLVKVADEKARKVETAPLKGECKTPDAVLQADL